MDNHDLADFISSIRKNDKGLKGLEIHPVNFEKFLAIKKKKGHLNLVDLASMYEWSKGILEHSVSIIQFIGKYHPDSPKYFSKDIEEKDEQENYTLALDLEEFIDSKSKKNYNKKGASFYIPDNYELAKIALKECRKSHKHRLNISDISFREIAMWESKSVGDIEVLVSFLEKKYIMPKLKKILKSEKIKEVLFNKDNVEFKYK